MNVRDRVELVVGDITKLGLDAIVNAANEAMLGGGGVDGAIHRAAGPGLLEECRSIGRCPTGEARITKGYLLPAKFVIHTVGPIWQGGDFGEADLLASCYRESLALAAGRGVRTTAFPCISTGVYSYPPDKACAIAVETTLAWLAEHSLPEQVTFCC
ncbi:MAG TPA: O-acetyl-ADP-ribose deacetylase, partial [Pirellulales bacterium]